MNKKEQIKIAETIAQAKEDPALKAEMLLHPKKALEKAGISFPNELQISIHENTFNHYHLVIPHHKLDKKQQIHQLEENSSLEEICRFIITEWQNNGEKKSAFKKNPIEALEKLGVKPPKNLQLQIHENTENQMHLVLPKENSKDLDELELRQVAGGKHHGGHKSGKHHLRSENPSEATISIYLR